MRDVLGLDRNPPWLLAVAVLALGASVMLGRSEGRLIDFFAGFFLGFSLALAASSLFLRVSRRRSPST